jgi:signal transduction histidine kinase/CheY-like chemotaxis protein
MPADFPAPRFDASDPLDREAGVPGPSAGDVSAQVKRLYAALSALNGGVLLVSEERRVEFANQAFCDLFQLTGACRSLIGLTADEVMARIEASYVDGRAARARIVAIVERGEPVSGEEVALSGGRTCLRDFVPLFIDGERYGRLWYHQDITALKRMESEHLALRERLQHVQKAESLGRMAGAVAHLFNNRLCVVMGNLEKALEELPADAGVRPELFDALTSARQAADVSGMMRTYLGQSTEAAGAVDLAETCRRQLPALQDAQPDTVALTLDLPERGPVVRANERQVRQVVTHLVTNAWEAMAGRRGTITVAARVVPASGFEAAHLEPAGWVPIEPEYACLEVKDAGSGIVSTELNHLFDPFFTTKVTGRGLGLAVTLGILKAWGGAIDVRSTVGEGSTFRVYLPLERAQTQPARPAAAEPGPYVAGGAVLLVEDEAMVRAVTTSMLERLGHEVVAVADGGDAVKALRAHPGRFRCVITDLSMPGMGGWQTVEALRQIEPDLPVILASGFDEREAMAASASLSGHMPAFLHKPYSKADLGRALACVLGRPANG